MSKSAHQQSEYKLRQLPRCPKCKKHELVLVTVQYGPGKDIAYEWECTKCQKSIPREWVKEEELTIEDQKLQQWCKNEQRKDTRRKRNFIR